MNYSILAFILMFDNVISVKDAKTCDPKAETDWEYKKIDPIVVCSGPKPCLVKCCGKDEVIHGSREGQSCEKIDFLKEKLKNNLTGIPLDYSTMKIYKSSVRYKALSSKSFLKDFTLLNCPMFKYQSKKSKCHFTPDESEYILSEDGYLVSEAPNHYHLWKVEKNVKFCVDMIVGKKSGKMKSSYIFRVKSDDIQSMIDKTLYSASAMLVSSFFLALVLLVYALLPQLRNMKGMLLVAYVSTLLLAFTAQGSHLFYRYYERFYSGKKESDDCTHLSQVIYFLMLACFFWLNVMSFDLWWTFRASRKRREVHRRGVNVKFLIYALYAYGVPACMTIFAAVMDKKEFPPHVIKPFFSSCLADNSFFIYLYVPLMILTGANCLLFLMTIYNIWLIRHTITTFNKNGAARKSDHDQNRFWLYVRLASLTGVGWILDLAMSDIEETSIPVWLHIALSLYSLLTGPVIFVMFVCKRNILLMLSRRFNIENEFTRKMLKNHPSNSEQSRNTKSSRTRSATDSEQEEAP